MPPAMVTDPHGVRHRTARALSLRGRVSPFRVMDVLARANAAAQAGRDVIHLEAGQPAAGAPAAALAAAGAALHAGPLGYTETLGIPALRRGIAELYRRRYGIALAPERVIVTTGSSAAFLLALVGLFDAGQRIALAEPGYPAYRSLVSALDLEVVPFRADQSTGFHVLPQAIEALGAIDGAILASPANPTGTLMRPGDLADVADLAARNGWRLILDEIYHGLTFEAPATSVLACSDAAIVVSSFSKYHAMTGWRIGWMVVPEDLVRPIECLAQNLYISPPTIAQHAALAALDADAELEPRVAAYRRNRDRLRAALAVSGFGPIAPADGAFYLYAGLPDGAPDSETFCALMLDAIAVGMAPGVDFDPVGGHRTVRLSFAGDEARMAEAADRITAFMANGTRAG